MRRFDPCIVLQAQGRGEGSVTHAAIRRRHQKGNDMTDGASEHDGQSGCRVDKERVIKNITVYITPTRTPGIGNFPSPDVHSHSTHVRNHRDRHLATAIFTFTFRLLLSSSVDVLTSSSRCHRAKHDSSPPSKSNYAHHAGGQHGRQDSHVTSATSRASRGRSAE